jgi:hypothetical protein
MRPFLEAVERTGFSSFKPMELSNLINGLARLKQNPGSYALPTWVGGCGWVVG